MYIISGDEEGIYLLAKDLAYNVALNRTEKLKEDITKLTQKNMSDVAHRGKSNDPSTDSKIQCDQTNGTCSAASTNNFTAAFPSTVSATTQITATTAGHLSPQMVSPHLNGDQKGAVASAFAQEYEGAEIAIAVDIHQ